MLLQILSILAVVIMTI